MTCARLYRGMEGGAIVNSAKMEGGWTIPDLGMRFHHVGVAVRSIERALCYYRELFGFEQLTEPVEVAAERVRVCFLRAAPGVMIELVEGVGEGSPVDELLERFGAGTYHICYAVEDLDRALTVLRAHRCRPFRRFEVTGSGPRRFAFLLTPDRQLFELCEVPMPSEDPS